MGQITDIPHRMVNAGDLSSAININVYEGGTSTRVDIYSDPGLTNLLANPLSIGAGNPVPTLYHGFAGDIRVEVTDGSNNTIFDDASYERPVGEAELASIDSNQGASWVKVENGSTVQQVLSRQPLQVDAYYENGDSDDWAPAFERAYAAGQALSRNLVATTAATYRFLSSVDIWPNADGWTPSLDLQGSLIILGKESPNVADEAAGFRVRGIRSGALANSTGFQLSNGTIDHQNIHAPVDENDPGTGSNGTRGIWIENGSGWRISSVHGINCYHAQHFGNWRYIDGGPVGAQVGIVENCIVSGHILASISERTWYPYNEAGDLCTVVPGDSIAALATELIALPNAGNNSTGAPRVATPTLFKNETGSPIIVPETLTAGAMTAAGLTNIGTSAAWMDNPDLAGVAYIYYSSGGTRIPDAAIVAGQHIVRDCDFTGSRYGAYVSGSEEATFERVKVREATRGIAAEWSARNGRLSGCEVINPLSSAFLLGYGCSGWTVNDCLASALSDRWIGEGLFNFQLSSGNIYGRRNRTVTRSTNVKPNPVNPGGTLPNPVGQSHIHIAVNCSDIDFECDMRGDASKAYVAIESAWSRSVTGLPELYASAPGFQGGASQDMAHIRISGSITPISDKATGTGATMIALLQIADEVNGQVGLSYVDISGLRAGRSKIPVRYLKIYEGSTTAKQVNNCLLEDVEFPIETVPSTAAIRMILPRRWAHFRSVKNVTNIDDNVERIVPDVATPDLTFGKFWFDTGTTPLLGILGGQGASAAEGYNGREIVVRGHSSRAWTTISGGSGTRDALRITDSPVTPTAVQHIVLRYNHDEISWIGGLA